VEQYTRVSPLHYIGSFVGHPVTKVSGDETRGYAAYFTIQNIDIYEHT